MNLPKNWQERAIKLSDSSAKKFKDLGPGVWIDDDCPLQSSIVVVQEDGEVFRIANPAAV